MTLGANEILVCTTCGEKMSRPTTLSSNTFEAIYWSDGKREAPMCPDSPWLVLCPLLSEWHLRLQFVNLKYG